MEAENTKTQVEMEKPRQETQLEQENFESETERQKTDLEQQMNRVEVKRHADSDAFHRDLQVRLMETQRVLDDQR